MPANTIPFASTLVLGLAACSGSALGAFLYSNGSADPAVPAISTGSTTGSGAAVPGDGGWWSELQTAGGFTNAIAGFSNHTAGATGAYRFADDFTVAGTAHGWRISTIRLYAYRTGIDTFEWPANGVNIRIWNGEPDLPDSQVVWGDTTTNRIQYSTRTLVYRVFNTTSQNPGTPDTSRAIWQIDATTPGLDLAPGKYWLDWQLTNTEEGAEIFAPCTTIAGARGTTNANAKQFKHTSGGQWVNLIDGGKEADSPDHPQDLPFILIGAPAPPACAGDSNGDLVVDFSDIASTLTAWGSNYAPGSGVGDGDGDGIVGFGDLNMILVNWALVCR